MSSTSENRSTALSTYRLLGRSGLRVSPLCLGTMNFGDKWAMMGEITKGEAENIFTEYVSNGGNFIDTANKYHEGQSEEWVGEFMTKHSNRDDLVIATKYSLPMKANGINMAGNHRKNMFHALEQSLKRLNTHYIDLYYVHFWDFTTPHDELMRALDDIVRSGKVHYIAISDTPAWEVSAANVLAELHGWSRFIAYQGRYSLVDRTSESDVLPMSRKMGLGFVPWGALGQGLLTGKFKRGDDQKVRTYMTPTDKEYAIAEEVVKVAGELNASPSQVALQWVLAQPGNTSAVVGCRKVEQLKDNISSFDVKLTADHLARLDAVSKYDPGFPHNFLEGHDYTSNRWLRMAGKIAAPSELPR